MTSFRFVLQWEKNPSIAGVLLDAAEPTRLHREIIICDKPIIITADEDDDDEPFSA